MASEPAIEQPAVLGRTQSAGRTLGDRFWQIVILAILILSAMVSLFPLYWLFVTAITPASATVKLPPELIPTNPTLDNITNLIQVIVAGEKPLIAGCDVLDSLEFVDECYAAATRFPMPWYETIGVLHA